MGQAVEEAGERPFCGATGSALLRRGWHAGRNRRCRSSSDGTYSVGTASRGRRRATPAAVFTHVLRGGSCPTIRNVALPASTLSPRRRSGRPVAGTYGRSASTLRRVPSEQDPPFNHCQSPVGRKAPAPNRRFGHGMANHGRERASARVPEAEPDRQAREGVGGRSLILLSDPITRPPCGSPSPMNGFSRSSPTRTTRSCCAPARWPERGRNGAPIGVHVLSRWEKRQSTEPIENLRDVREQERREATAVAGAHCFPGRTEAPGIQLR